MTSLCDGVHTISTNKREGNVHPLLRRVNKIALAGPFLSFHLPLFFFKVTSSFHLENRGALRPQSQNRSTFRMDI
ncbi:hypothetical protein RHMOL_Rhmol06G0202400 [Rhododendron molle]|uniref:Uncharacterized protein n=1 Tax=Rhododendron molle TaxID=49168 RepID=A0ACC0NGC0_RHOML|nr:hypothetical protein RHMOL_Rhmol06G0202400 [Rhododendron molle]